jgi:hypothetical protein
MTENITIENVKYEIIEAKTAAAFDDAGLHNIAANMRLHKQNRQMTLRRPNGKKIYWTIEFITKYGTCYNRPISFR